MTAEQLIEEGRRIQPPTVFLRPVKQGDIAARWYDDEDDYDSPRTWMSVESQHIPGLPSGTGGILSIVTEVRDSDGGRVEIGSSWPKKKGTDLYAHPAAMLPSLNYVFAHGSDVVGDWLARLEWERDWGYNSNFKDKSVTDAYWDVMTSECPLYSENDVYAILGGTITPINDPEVSDDHLVLLTLRDSEPWLEVRLNEAGEFRVFQRIT